MAMKIKPKADQRSATEYRERKWELSGEDIVRLLGFDPDTVDWDMETTRCDDVLVTVTESVEQKVPNGSELPK